MKDQYEGACRFQPDRSPRRRNVAGEDDYCPRHSSLISQLCLEGAEAMEKEGEEADEYELDDEDDEY